MWVKAKITLQKKSFYENLITQENKIEKINPKCIQFWPIRPRWAGKYPCSLVVEPLKFIFCSSILIATLLPRKGLVQTHPTLIYSSLSPHPGIQQILTTGCFIKRDTFISLADKKMVLISVTTRVLIRNDEKYIWIFLIIFQHHL